MILSIPEGIYPPETKQNLNDPEYKEVVRYCRWIESERRTLCTIVEMIQEADVEPTWDGDRYTWWIFIGDPPNSCKLHVSPSDTLKFEMHWTGPKYGTRGAHWEGWLLKDGSEGRISQGKISTLRWSKEQWGRRMEWFKSHVAADSIEGGGWLVIHSRTGGQLLLEAHWDDCGHGYISFPGYRDW